MGVCESTFDERIDRLSSVFSMLTQTTSLNEKRAILDCIPNSLQDDLQACLDVLANRVTFGYKMARYEHIVMNRAGSYIKCNGFVTIREALTFLLRPRNVLHDLSDENIIGHLWYVRDYWTFFQPIVDRTLKLGIGPSVMDKLDTAPMLAKTWKDIADDVHIYDKLFITEKLDGNRCIAIHDGYKWNFVSRNGKPMYVDFDMLGLPTNFIYDGEVCSLEQLSMSHTIHWAATHHLKPEHIVDNFGATFNKTNGMINKHSSKDGLVYTIFDVQNSGMCYTDRRIKILDNLTPLGKNVRILPVIGYYNLADTRTLQNFNNIVAEKLFIVTSLGGEGLMINKGSGKYERKRSNTLLKVKNNYTMDMLVVGVYAGNGKYDGMIGGLVCQAITSDGKVINCNVGTGLSDIQRHDWSIHKEQIIGKIVEIEYFAISQDQDAVGTNHYSLRFPRLKKIRSDKQATSTY